MESGIIGRTIKLNIRNTLPFFIIKNIVVLITEIIYWQQLSLYIILSVAELRTSVVVSWLCQGSIYKIRFKVDRLRKSGRTMIYNHYLSGKWRLYHSIACFYSLL